MQSSKDIPRIVMYSHDTMGLGHFRRNLLIANELSKSKDSPNILLISGAKEAEFFSLPPRVDCLTLPSLYKEKNGKYRSRRLDLSLSELIEIRSKIIQSTISSMEPDVFIVDGVPWGVEGELTSTLGYLSTKSTKCIFGIRDIWDESHVIQKEWKNRNNFDAINRYYDQMWIYGDKSTYNPETKYNLPISIRKKIKFTGYLHQKSRLELMTYKDKMNIKKILNSIGSPFVLCLLGSGQDGFNLARDFIKSKLPPQFKGVVLTGPHMEKLQKENLYKLAQKNPNMMIIEFCNEPTALLRKAELVVTMGGYNSICEILSFRKKSLVVPRIVPRKEQLIRALKMESKGFLDVLYPDQLNSNSISSWIDDKIHTKETYDFEMHGLSTISNLVTNLIHEKSPTQPKLSQGVLTG